MREFFGLILFVGLLCVWSWVFADSDEQAPISVKPGISVESTFKD